MEISKRVKRGDIYYIANSKCYVTNPDDTAGRPGIIVSADALNERSPLVQIVYLTGKEKPPMPTHVSVMCAKPSTALCENLMTVSKDRLCDYVRTCTDEEMADIDDGIRSALGLAAVPRPVESAEREVDNSRAAVERDIYKSLYEQLLDKIAVR